MNETPMDYYGKCSNCGGQLPPLGAAGHVCLWPLTSASGGAAMASMPANFVGLNIHADCQATIAQQAENAALKADRDSWRRTAEKIESQSASLRRVLGEIAKRCDCDAYNYSSCVHSMAAEAIKVLEEGKV